MDENMPRMNGMEATKHIREIEQESSFHRIPIIAVTANALVGDKEKFLEVGMDDYISKPYAEDDIANSSGETDEGGNSHHSGIFAGQKFLQVNFHCFWGIWQPKAAACLRKKSSVIPAIKSQTMAAGGWLRR